MGYAFASWRSEVVTMIEEILEKEHDNPDRRGVASKIFDALHPTAVAC